MPEELRVSGVAWRVATGPLQGRRFVGGYYAVGGVGARIREAGGSISFESWDPLRLDLPGFTFFGLEENILRQVVEVARSRSPEAADIEPFQLTEFFYSGFSVLRDGSVLAPLEFMVPEQQVTF